MSLANTTKEEATQAVKDAAKGVEQQIRATGEQAYDSVKTEAERLAVERRDVVASYARQRPAVFLGGAFLLSFALVRYFSRSSAPYQAPERLDQASADPGI